MKKLILLGIALFILANSGKSQHSISGYIVSLETAEPIPNATVFLDNQYGIMLEDSPKVTSDSAGFYEITGIDTGSYLLNAWTTYRAMNQRYAMLIQSNMIEVNRSLSVDIVFSENAFKYKLNAQYHTQEALEIFSQHRRTSDSVAWRAVLPQIYIDSKKGNIGSSYIQQIAEVEN